MLKIQAAKADERFVKAAADNWRDWTGRGMTMSVPARDGSDESRHGLVPRAMR